MDYKANLLKQMRNNNHSTINFKSYSREPSTYTRKNPNLYNIVTNYRTYTELPDHAKYHHILKKFVQHTNNKVLFIFGPSGCGKHMLINNFLDKHRIPYEYRAQLVTYKKNQFDFDNFDMDQSQIQKKGKGLRDLIIQSLSEQYTHKIQIYEDFPIPNSQIGLKQLDNIKNFKIKFFSQIKNSSCKIIFILNSQIYNRFYILPKQCPQQLIEITLKSYSINEVKSILKNFTKQHFIFQSVCKNKDSLDEIIQISGGDMRKILLNIFQHSISSSRDKLQYLDKENKMQYKFKLKNQQRFPLFHMLGKYLYAKRYDQYNKKDRVFTRKQLQASDPPFYFDPVDMFMRSNVPLQTFGNLLFQNYLAKISQIKDASQITQLYSFLDRVFPIFITNKIVDSLNEQSQKMYVFLLTWGIILKNKSSANIDKKFSSFRKSESKYIENECEGKKQLLREYFPYWRLNDLVRWGYIVKNSRTTKQYLINTIIKKRKRQQNLVRDQKQRVLEQEEQQQIIKQQNQSKQNDFIKAYQSKKKAKHAEQIILKQIQAEGIDSSDIDEQN